MRIRWGAMGCLLFGMALATPAFSQDAPQQGRQEGAGCPAGCPMHEGGGCPMMKAREAGARATVEETDRGALIRIEAPAGDEAARDEARKAAQRIAVMLEQGCPAAKGKAVGTKQGEAPGPRQGQQPR